MNDKDKIATEMEVLESFSGNGESFSLVSFGAEGKSPTYAVIDQAGRFHGVSTNYQTILDTWQLKTGIIHSSHGLPEILGKLLKKRLKLELSQNLEGYALNYQMDCIYSVMAEYLKPYIDFINKLGDLYVEHRSDVSDMCDMFLKDGTMPTEDMRESRFIKAILPDGTELCYDTLTTYIEYKPVDGEWKILDVDYED